MDLEPGTVFAGYRIVQQIGTGGMGAVYLVQHPRLPRQDAMKVIHSSPGLEDLWQLHFSLLSGQEYTVPGAFIANGVDQPGEAMPVATWTPPLPGQQAPPAPVHNGKANYFKVTAQQGGAFTVTNTRNNFSKTYRAGAGANGTK